MPRFFHEGRTALSSARWPRNRADHPSIGLPIPGRASIALCAPAFVAFMAFTPAVAAAQYSAYVNIVEGSIRCRQGLLWPYQGPLLSYEAWLKDPRGNTVGNQDKETYSWRLDGEYSVEPQTSGTYTCYSRFSADGFYLETKQDAKFINNCGDQRGEIIKEYHDTSVAFTPTCDSFTQSVPGTSHYSFGQWNSGSYSWALLETSVTSNTYCVVNNYGSTPSFSSGYRNPVHNLAVGGALNSRHVHGDAVDLHTPASPDDTAYNTLRYLAKQVGCGVACVEPRSISPAHYHGDYRGGCPTGW